MITVFVFCIAMECDRFSSLKTSNRLVRERNFDNDGYKQHRLKLTCGHQFLHE